MPRRSEESRPVGSAMTSPKRLGSRNRSRRPESRKIPTCSCASRGSPSSTTVNRPLIPKCTARVEPPSTCSRRYLARRSASNTRRFTNLRRRTLPSTGSRSARLHTRTASIRAPQIRGSRLRRSTSTSGSSGTARCGGQIADQRGQSRIRLGALTFEAQLGLQDS